jgi:hypothetical protein
MKTSMKIPNYPDYEVTNKGIVRRTEPRKGAPAKDLKTHLDKNGRAYVTLMAEGKQKKLYLATLVGETFLGKPGPGQRYQPKDGNPLNCAASNLESVYYQRGSRNGNVKVSDEEIQKLLKKKLPVKEIAQRLGVTKAAIYRRIKL